MARTCPIDLPTAPRSSLVDDGGKPLDALLVLVEDLAAAVDEAVAQGYAVMPAGGLTSAIGSFEYDKAATGRRFRDVVALRPKGALVPTQVPAQTPIESLRSDQVALDRDGQAVTVGAGVTFAQVNALLAEQIGPAARVLIDLTSVASAFAGGVLATGGMGPLRLRPSATCEVVCLVDGRGRPRLLRGDAIAAVEGLQGWTGMITAVRMRYFEVPAQEFGLVLPVQGSDIDAIADLLAYLHPWTVVELPGQGNRLGGGHGGNTIVNGIELISRDALEQFVAHAADPARSKALGLLQACDYAGADLLACLTGWSDVPVDEVLGLLIDEETETIGGVGIDYGVGFSSGTEMDTFRAIREGAPDLARTQARVTPPGRLKPWTSSTDVNIAAPRDSAAIANLLLVYQDYRRAIAALREQFAGRVEISLSIYGHLSPAGIDPHHRVTLIAPCGGEAALAEASRLVAARKQELIRGLLRAAETYGCSITGGEKGVPSLVDIARAAGGAEHLPAPLRQRMALARQSIAAAPAGFGFRAPPELAPPGNL